ncbi:MAG: bifunctional precorrin-2 dehydrogenase/sirohydrochlorin ferrochelatase [Spirochaetes bacterium]|nr:bifunctional precorrin-2 dehydrogenase/sirohydrochlorin ferrochelatase [Spirochaetota bacterium]
MKLYPAMLNVSGKRVLVVGGGEVALRKMRDILECGGIVTAIAPDFHESITALRESAPDAVTLVRRPFRQGDCDGFLIVFSATDDEATNSLVFREAQERNIFINAVDDPENCTFFVPSWFSRGDLLVAVSTGGISPSLAARIRRDIEKLIPESIEEILDALMHARQVLRNDSEFAELTSYRRGIILKTIVMDDNLLNGLVASSKNDTLKDFIKKI